MIKSDYDSIKKSVLTRLNSENPTSRYIDKEKDFNKIREDTIESTLDYLRALGYDIEKKDHNIYDRKDYEYLKSDFYCKDENKYYTQRNEPSPIPNITNSIEYDFNRLRSYPNMKSIYDNFSNYFNINKDNFILTNGCEEALRIAIAVLKRKYKNINQYISEYPTWGMSFIVANQFFDVSNIRKLEYKIDKNKLSFDYYGINLAVKDSIVYSTDIYNNLFSHDDISTIKFNSINSYFIIDETYTLNKLIDRERNIEREFKTITIGSFSKSIGCGIRLGYIIFPRELNYLFQLYRPQYLGNGSFINNMINTSSPENKLFNKLLNNFRVKLKESELEFKHDSYNKDQYIKGKNLKLITIHPNFYTTIDLGNGDNKLENVNKVFTLKDINDKEYTCYRHGIEYKL